MGGNEAGLVHVSFSYTLRIPFVLYTYEILGLGSISCLKVLEEINSKIITVILTSTALFMRNEKNAEGIGTFDTFTTKGRIDPY